MRLDNVVNVVVKFGVCSTTLSSYNLYSIFDILPTVSSDMGVDWNNLFCADDIIKFSFGVVLVIVGGCSVASCGLVLLLLVVLDITKLSGVAGGLVSVALSSISVMV